MGQNLSCLAHFPAKCARIVAASLGLAAICTAQAAKSPHDGVKLLVGGDVTWTLGFKAPAIVYDQKASDDPDWRPVPHVNQEIEHSAATAPYNLKFASALDALRYPLRRMRPLFEQADITFVNLETPLSDTARQVGDYRTPAAFASVLRWSGITAVTIANNHTFDAEERGFRDTLRYLRAAGVGFVGGGLNLDEATRPLIVVRNGIRIGFLGYSQFSNAGEAAFAAAGRAGIAPMDPELIKHDIIALRPKVDYIAVALHWGTDHSDRVSPENREFAHQLIEDGADMVLGAHTPYPKGIEIYRGKLIIYSPAHIASGHEHLKWGDDYLVQITLRKPGIQRVEIVPIAGAGMDLSQPYALSGERAAKLLAKIRTLSAELNTDLEIHGDRAEISPAK